MIEEVIKWAITACKYSTWGYYVDMLVVLAWDSIFGLPSKARNGLGCMVKLQNQRWASWG